MSIFVKSNYRKFGFVLLILLFNIVPFDSVLASDADSWRKVRQGITGYSAVSGQEANVLIQANGQSWRLIRNKLLLPYAAWSLALTGLALGVFFLFRGQVKLVEPRTGKMIPRWSGYERILHWLTALLFCILTITGFSLLLGRKLLIPLIGHMNFSEYAQWAKTFHNFTGPLFIVGLLLMIFTWLHDNLPNALDIQWIKKFGGFIGHQHPSAERMNAGEKGWFWILIFAGLAISLTGLVLDFTIFELSREWLQLSHIIHCGAALLLAIGSLGHIYIGTIGTEGAFEGMLSGKVDSSWAKQHHDLWYDEINNKDTE